MLCEPRPKSRALCHRSAGSRCVPKRAWLIQRSGLIADVALVIWHPPGSPPKIGGNQRKHKNNAHPLGIGRWHQQGGAGGQHKQGEDLVGREWRVATVQKLDVAVRTSRLLNLRDVPLCIGRYKDGSRLGEGACATRAAVLPGDQALIGWRGERRIALGTDCISARQRAPTSFAGEGSRAWR